jgi:tetratricopeptide (TPR) repeat protein
MLTGRAPFQGNAFEVLPRVVAGSWAPPGQVKRGVPPALDAVCRKAMALRPPERYGSAQELAKDVEAWLADEPVTAYPEPWGTRLSRWARKHPGQVTGAVVLLVTAVVGLTVGTVLLERSKRQAEDSYRKAREGVNRFLREVSEDVLLDEPGMRELRLGLLTAALDEYEGVLKIRPGDPDVRQQQAESFRLRGGLEGELGRTTQGKACVERAVALYEGLLREKPADRELRFGLARCRLWLAELQVKSGEPAAARETLSGAMASLSTLRAEEPGRIPVLDLLGRCHDLRATAEAQRGDVAAALRDNREALSLLVLTIATTRERLPQAPGGDRPAWGTEPFRSNRQTYVPLFTRVNNQEVWTDYRLVGGALTTRGMLLEATGQTADSARVFQEAADHFAWLSEQNPRSGRFRHALALAWLGTGRAEVELGRPAAGEGDLRKAIGLLEKLGEQDPLVPEYKSSLLRARGYLGECLFVRGRHQAAADLLRDVVKRGEEFEDPDRLLLADRPRFLCALGRLGAESGRPDEALSHYQRAARLRQEAQALAPSNPSLRDDLLRTREALSGLRLLAGEIDLDGRIGEQRQICREREELARGDPPSPQLRSAAGESAAVLAGLLLQAGRPREALDVVGQALPLHEALLQADLQRWQEGREREQPLRAGNSLRTALELAAGIGPRRPVPPSLRFRAQWAELLAHQGAALAATGQGAAGGQCVARAVALGEEASQGTCCYFCPPSSCPAVWSALAVELYRQDPEPGYLCDLAGHLALASTLPGAGIPDPASRAVRALRALAASGFDNPHKLQRDERLAPLRDRQDFKDLLRQLQAQAAAGPAAPRQH